VRESGPIETFDMRSLSKHLTDKHHIFTSSHLHIFAEVSVEHSSETDAIAFRPC
jgi:hypothetical protein